MVNVFQSVALLSVLIALVTSQADRVAADATQRDGETRMRALEAHLRLMTPWAFPKHTLSDNVGEIDVAQPTRALMEDASEVHPLLALLTNCLGQQLRLQDSQGDATLATRALKEDAGQVIRLTDDRMWFTSTDGKPDDMRALKAMRLLRRAEAMAP